MLVIMTFLFFQCHLVIIIFIIIFCFILCISMSVCWTDFGSFCNFNLNFCFTFFTLTYIHIHTYMYLYTYIQTYKYTNFEWHSKCDNVKICKQKTGIDTMLKKTIFKLKRKEEKNFFTSSLRLVFVVFFFFCWYCFFCFVELFKPVCH